MQLQDLLINVATIITSCGTISVAFKKFFINPITKKMDDSNMFSLKCDLVNFLNDLEHGVPKSQIQKMNAHEMYDRYTKLGGNSYVREHWERLEREGKI